MSGIVNAGKREKSERGGKPKAWPQTAQNKAREVEGSSQEVKEVRSLGVERAW